MNTEETMSLASNEDICIPGTGNRLPLIDGFSCPFFFNKKKYITLSNKKGFFFFSKIVIVERRKQILQQAKLNTEYTSEKPRIGWYEKYFYFFCGMRSYDDFILEN